MADSLLVLITGGDHGPGSLDCYRRADRRHSCLSGALCAVAAQAAPLAWRQPSFAPNADCADTQPVRTGVGVFRARVYTGAPLSGPCVRRHFEQLELAGTGRWFGVADSAIR